MKAVDAHILVIEDDINNQEVIRGLLMIAGVEHIHIQPTGWEGLRVAQEQMPQVDLILLDIQLPGEDGYSVLQRIRASQQFQQTRVVAVTSNVMPQDMAKARTAGFDGFIGKPLDFDLFPRQVAALLQGEQVWRNMAM